MKKRRKLLLACACCIAGLMSASVLFACKSGEESYDDWHHDENYHWRYNSKGEEVDRGIHNFLWWECTLCHYQKAPPEHVHSFDVRWSYNEMYHWHAQLCDCEDVEVEEIPHSFAEGSDVCSVCGYTKPPVIEEPDDKNDEDEPDVPFYPEDPDNKPDDPEPDPPSEPEEPDPNPDDEPEPEPEPEDPEPDEPQTPDPEDPEPDEPKPENPGPVDPEPENPDPTKPPYPESEGGEDSGAGQGSGSGGFDHGSPDIEAQKYLIFTPLIDSEGVTYAYTVKADKEKNKNKYIEIPATYDSKPVVAIDENGFSGMPTLQTIFIPSSIKEIGYEAFYKSENLKEISIPDSVTALGARAFAFCASLKDVKLPVNSAYTKIEYETFTYCTSLGNIFIPHQITYITTRAFEYAKLKSLTLGKGLTKIGHQAFNQSSIGNGVSVYSLEQWCKIEFSSQISSPLFWGHRLFIIDEKNHRLDELKELVVPSSIKTLGRFQFCGCTSITKVDMSGVEEVKDEVFINCTKIKSVKLPEDLSYFTSNLFYNCASLEEVTVPKNITSIPYCCFYNCSSLKKITLLGQVTFFGSLSISGCRSLQTIVYPGTEADWKNVVKRDGYMWSSSTGEFSIVFQDGKKLTKAEDRAKYTGYAPGDYAQGQTPSGDKKDEQEADDQ